MKRRTIFCAVASAAIAIACSKPDATETSRSSASASAAPGAPSAPAPSAASTASGASSASPSSGSAAPGGAACEVTKRIHTCQLSHPPCGGPCGEGMFACPPEESPAVNTVFKALGDAKAAIAACGKVAGATTGTFVVAGALADTQKGGKLVVTVKSGTGPTAECLAAALAIDLPKGGDAMKRQYALEAHVTCK